MKVTAIVGSYHKKGIIDSVIDEILAASVEEGADVTKIYLVDKQIEFCENCRQCTQVKELKRGKCPLNDDMSSILDEIDLSDAIILGSPMNFGTTTAIFKRFIERLICLTYWPWKSLSPRTRNKHKYKTAVIVVSSAAPSFLTRLQKGIVGILKNSASLLGARTIEVFYVGLAARKQKQEISQKTRKKARLLGKKLVGSNSHKQTS